jgi:mannose-6-phosphate isomerase
LRTAGGHRSGTGNPEGEASLISCYVPDLERDVISPLREAGYSDEEIRGLGQINV